MGFLKLRQIILFLASLFLENWYIADTAKIMCVSPIPVQSHAIAGSNLLRELARRGHNVTMVSPFPLNDKVNNYRDISLDIDDNKNIRNEQIVKASKFPPFNIYSTLDVITRMNDAVLSNKDVKSLIAKKETFDVVIITVAESLLGLSNALNASTILVSLLSINSYYGAFQRNPIPSAYVPHFVVPFTDQMTYVQRISNTIVNLFTDIYMEFVWRPHENDIVQKHFPGAPHLSQLQENLDLMLVNSHMTKTNVRPHLSNVIEIGGFLLNASQELSNELRTLLDKSSHGVVLFSMGTGMTAHIFGDKLKLILDSFASLPYQILWKNDGSVEGQPNNVKTMKWLPQTAVLRHPNVKLFITHGGQASTLEAIYHGVPMIILPICLDQHNNAAQSAIDGYAIHLDIETLTKEKFLWAVEEITTNSKYLDEITIRADAMRNQDVDPMEKAVYWVERVIQQKNAKYRKSAGQPMSLFQYYLIDVYALIVLLFFILTYGIRILIKIVAKCCKRADMIEKLSFRRF